MKQLHLLGATLIFSVFALDALPANAGIQVCNRTQKTVWVALAWDQSPGQWAATNSWGWVKVEPGGCKLGYEKALMTDGSMSYYAVVRDDGGFWGASLRTRHPAEQTHPRNRSASNRLTISCSLNCITASLGANDATIFASKPAVKPISG